jgi:flagellum-specific ATP synthase
VRSILDGHIVLTRELAHAGHYPAVDVLQSVSRLVGEVTAPDVRDAGTELRSLMAAHRDKADLIAIGAYERGSDPLADRAIDLRGAIDGFLRQSVDEPSGAEDADAHLRALVGHAAPAPAAEEDPVLAELVADAARAAPSPPPATAPSAIPPLHLSV